MEPSWEQLLEDLSNKYEFCGEPEDELHAFTLLFKDDIRCKIKSWLNTHVLLSSVNIKSDVIAIDWKNKGNDYFNKKNYASSLSCYNQSSMYCSRDSPHFSLILCNRGSVLLNTEKYNDALTDLMLAVKYNYPKEKIYKLYYKIAQCHFKLGDLSEGVSFREKAIECLKHESKLPQCTINVIEKKLKDMPVNSFLSNDSSSVNDMVVLKSENKFLRGASSSLCLRYSKDKGRYVIAKNMIFQGDILFVEIPYAFVTLPIQEYSLIVCNNCCKTCSSQYTCEFCTFSHYCSENCRLIGWNMFHQYECIGARFGLWEKIGIAHLALRVLLIGCQSKFELPNSLNDMSASAKIYFDIIKSEESLKFAYNKVFHLTTNFRNMNRTDLKTYTFAALLLLHYVMDHTSLFSDCFNKIFPIKMKKNEIELFVGSLLLKHICQMVCNSSVITCKCPKDISETFLATAIYPSSSMMNHSCVPNTKSRYIDGKFIVEAVDNINPGDEVFNCYGLQHNIYDKKDRQMILKTQYGFDCICKGCR